MIGAQPSWPGLSADSLSSHLDVAQLARNVMFGPDLNISRRAEVRLNSTGMRASTDPQGDPEDSDDEQNASLKS